MVYQDLVIAIPPLLHPNSSNPPSQSEWIHNNKAKSPTNCDFYQTASDTLGWSHYNLCPHRQRKRNCFHQVGQITAFLISNRLPSYFPQRPRSYFHQRPRSYFHQRPPSYFHQRPTNYFPNSKDFQTINFLKDFQASCLNLRTSKPFSSKNSKLFSSKTFKLFSSKTSKAIFLVDFQAIFFD